MRLSIERRMQLGFGLVFLLIISTIVSSFQTSARQQDLTHLVMLFVLAFIYRSVRTTHRQTVTTLESIFDGFFVLDTNWNFIYVNQQAEVLLKKRRTQLLGNNIWKVFPGSEITTFGQRYYCAAQEQVTQRFEAFYAPLNLWVEVVAYPSDKGLSVCFHDITARKTADERFRILFEQSSDAHLLFDETGIVDCNNATIQMLRCKNKAEVFSLHPAVLSPEVQPDGRRSDEKCIEMDRLARAKGYHRFEWMHRKTDGTDFPVEVTLTPVLLNGKDTLLTVWHDMTERVEAEREKNRIATILEASPDFVGTATQEGLILYQNSAFNKMLGVTQEEIASTRPHISRFMPAWGVEKIKQETLPIIARQGHWQGETALLRPDGTEMPVLMTMIGHKEVDSDIQYMSVIFRDITARKETEEFLAHANKQLELQIQLVREQATKLEEQKAELETANQRLTTLATTDGLTGLYNHRAFQERLNEEFMRAKRYETPLSILLLDVDKFKTYNDTFGHPEGDILLQKIARIMESGARASDYVCRYGGEEFVIILPNTNGHGAIIAAERFRNAIERQPWRFRPVTASFGVSTFHTEMKSAQELIAQADRALYFSKEKGRNLSTHFTALPLLEELGELAGNTSLPYSDIVREMLQIHQEALTSASEQIRGTLSEAYNATILSWSRLLDMKDKETEGHSERVTEMMVCLAENIGMNPEEAMYARWGALLHDVGKMSVPDGILHKPGPLTDDEWVIMRRHTNVAYEMLSPVTFLRPALDIPYYHHEKWDGTGYPHGLKGEDIPISARLFAVIDVYDALTSDRPYRAAWSQEKTVAHLRSLAGTHFDPRAVNVFLAMLNQREATQKVKQNRLAA